MTLFCSHVRFGISSLNELSSQVFVIHLTSHLTIPHCPRDLYSHVELDASTLWSHVTNMFKRSPICSYLPIHFLSHCYSPKFHTTLFLVLFWRWEIHHFPPSARHFLSTLAHYLGRWLRNSLSVPYSWHALMVNYSHPTTSIYYWLSNGWFHECLTSTSLSHSQIALLYFENHCHYWWFLSYLLTIHITSQ